MRADFYDNLRWCARWKLLLPMAPHVLQGWSIQNRGFKVLAVSHDVPDIRVDVWVKAFCRVVKRVLVSDGHNLLSNVKRKV